MRVKASFAFVAALASSAVSAEEPRTYVGVITDTMCGASHAAMNVVPETKCVRECVGDGKTYRYAWSDGKVMYTLSDQETPAKFAGQRVKVTGTLYAKTKILKVQRIDKVK